MANKKFSDFDLKTNSADVAFVVGFNGTDNVRIAPSDLSSGGGATDLNGLSDCLVDTDSLYVGEVPSSLSGNPQGNTVLGIDAGATLTSGSSNTLIGNDAAEGITSGFQNVAIGQRALSTSAAKFGNTAIGYLSGQFAVANLNTFVGKEAGRGNSNGGNTGFANVVVGGSAYNNFTSGSGNVAIGYQCLINGVHTGSNNVFVGRDILVGTAFTGSNSMALGYTAAPSAASVSNEITLGNSSITALRCAVTSITSLSDERDKTEIKDLGFGLAFIDALQPREFVWNNRAEIKTETDDDGNETEVEFYSANKGKKDFGFIAQEVKELDNDTLRLVYDENPEKLELSYGKLVPVLVQAIKELKAEIELLKS